MKKIIAILLCFAMCFCAFSVCPSAEEQQTLWGDADGNGEITITDALVALQCAVGLRQPDEQQTKIIDVDGDNEITVTDALFILQKFVKVRRLFPVEFGDGYIYFEKDSITLQKGGCDFIMLETFLKPEVAESYSLLATCNDERVAVDFGEWQTNDTIPLFVRAIKDDEQAFTAEIIISIEDHEEINRKLAVTVVRTGISITSYKFEHKIFDFGIYTNTAPYYMILSHDVVEDKDACHILYSYNEVSDNFNTFDGQDTIENFAESEYASLSVRTLDYIMTEPIENEYGGVTYGFYNETTKKFFAISTVTIEGEKFYQVDIVLDPITLY